MATCLRRGRHLGPEEAKAYGLVDEVVSGRAEVKRLEMERDILKKATAFFAAQSK